MFGTLISNKRNRCTALSDGGGIAGQHPRHSLCDGLVGRRLLFIDLLLLPLLRRGRYCIGRRNHGLTDGRLLLVILNGLLLPTNEQSIRTHIEHLEARMAEIPDHIEYAVLDIETGAARLPFRDIEADHLRGIGQSRMRPNLLMDGAQNPIIDLQTHGIEFRLVLKEGRRC